MMPDFTEALLQNSNTFYLLIVNNTLTIPRENIKLFLLQISDPKLFEQGE